MMMYKIVVRERTNNKVVQIHEVYESSVSSKVDEILDEWRKLNVVQSITITPLTK